ncbi:hypothetical protein [Edaphobacter sp. 12200R-103]|uniref:hypothetical protein n=1 Tax=Edaphobacter sp. 12200R-103 TaxID=2703788 RepID=UPI00138CCF8A|nr:hypothetical protein [Edaphobacter sp. 12200R-103]QHS52359.1 hypothetical protein GWR55_11965 [Edaphobacter sp. 12200R-103]
MYLFCFLKSTLYKQLVLRPQFFETPLLLQVETMPPPFRMAAHNRVEVNPFQAGHKAHTLIPGVIRVDRWQRRTAYLGHVASYDQDQYAVHDEERQPMVHSSGKIIRNGIVQDGEPGHAQERRLQPFWGLVFDDPPAAQ